MKGVLRAAGLVLTILVFALLAAAGRALWLYRPAGPFVAAMPGTCAPLSGIDGAEDAVRDAATGLVYVAADGHRAARDSEARGRILALDLSGPEPRLADMTPELPARFAPFGIGLYVDRDGTRMVHVVNRPARSAPTVEIFTVEGDRLVHRETVSDSASFIALNDVLPVGPRRFYATNDHATRGLRRAWGDLLKLADGDLVYFDGTIAEPVVRDLGFANGIVATADGRGFLLAETTALRLRHFARDAESGRVAEQGRTVLDSGPDNLSLAADGTMLVAAHPHLLRTLAHLAWPRIESPSRVVRLDGAGGAPVTVLNDTGAFLSGASVALLAGDTLFLGSIADGARLCRTGSAPAP